MKQGLKGFEGLLNLDSLPPFFLVDREGCVQSFNKTAGRTAARLLGREPEEGEPVYFLFGEAVIPELAKGLEAAWNGANTRVFLPSGHEVSLEPYYSNGRVEAVCLTLDLREEGRYGAGPQEDTGAERSKEHSEDFLYRVLDSLPISLMVTDREGVFKLVRSHPQLNKDYNLRDLPGKSVWEVLEGAPDKLEAWKRVLAGETFQTSWPSDTGEVFEIYFTPLVNREGQLEGGVAISLNITARAQAEAALRESEEIYRAMFAAAPIGILKVSPQGKIIEANGAFHQMLGYDPAGDPLKNMSVLDITYPEDLEQTIQALREVVEKKKGILKLEKRYLRKDGSPIWAHVSRGIVTDTRGEPTYQIVMVEDITERYQAQAQLQKSEKMYRTLAQNFPDGSIFLFDRTLRYLAADGKALATVGLTTEMLRGKQIWEVLPEETCRIVEPLYQAALAGKESLVEDLGYKEFHYNFQVLPLFNEEGEIYAGMAVATDITGQKKAQKALEESEAKLRAALNSLSRAYYLIGPDFRIQLFNQHAFEVVWNVRKIKLEEGFLFPDLLEPENQAEFYRDFERALSGEYVTVEKMLSTQKGPDSWTEIRYNPVVEKDGTVSSVCVTMQNISERKQAEARLKASLNEKELLLKEVHHRVKNNLQVISSLLKLQSNLVQDPQTQAVLKESQQRVRSMALIHEKLYQSGDLTRIDFGQYLKSLTSQLFRTYTPEGVNIKFGEMEGICLKIDQAIPCGLIVSELITNALKYAFPPELTGKREIYLSLKPQLEGNRLELNVVDTGVGMPADDSRGKSGALGLQLVEMLARQLDGQLKINSNPGGGTRVCLSFGV